MLKKLQEIFEKYWKIIVYLFFGALTTLVNYLVYFPLYNIAGVSATVSNGIAWCFAVIVAFVTNKPFVFKSCNWSARVVVPEFFKFVGGRIGSGLLESGILFFTVDILCWNGNLLKVLTSILVVLLNYIVSKFFVFRSYNS